jgi:thiol-disulfide isomerase/thioredoxin
VLTGAALQGANVGTTLLLLAYAAGAATSLGLALLIGGRVFAVMKKSLGVGEWVRRGLGVLVLAGVAAISLGLDTGALARLSIGGTSTIEQALLDNLKPAEDNKSSVLTSDSSNTMMMSDKSNSGMMSANNPSMMMANKNSNTAMSDKNPGMMMAANPAMMAMKPKNEMASNLPIEGKLPSLDGAVEWLNSKPLTTAELKGKVVVVDFWTYSCINCIRSIPYVRAWAEKYKDQGLVVIGVHAPEFAFEKNVDNVKSAIDQFKIGYPVTVDNDYAIWRAFDNHYWPAHYFIDAQGRIRGHHFGEGEYDKSEKIIQQLLAEAGKTVTADVVKVNASGAEAAADMAEVKSPETYLGYERAENFASPGGAVKDAMHSYDTPANLTLNQWALKGGWTVDGEHAVLNQANGAISYKFHARDLHLVLGPSTDGKPVRFKVLIDGKAPGKDHGVDTDDQGNGTVTQQRLYQLVRQSGGVADRQFEIQFLDPGTQAFAFTFG